MSSFPVAPAPVAPEPSGEIDLGALWAAVKARKWWVIVPTLVTVVAAGVTVSMLPPRFTSEARILLESRESFFTRPAADREGGASSAAPNFDSEGVQSQVQVITSFDLSRKAIPKIGLVGNSEFDPAETGLGALSRLLVLLGLQKNPTERTPENRVLENYYDRLTVYPVGKSRVVAIEFSSRDAELSAKAANTIAALYLETVQAAKKDTARSAGSFLSAAIEPLRTRVAEAEAKVEAFRAKVGLIVSTNNATIVQQQLAEASTQLSAARDAKTQAETRAKQIREMLRSGRVFEISEIVNNELIRRLIEQRGVAKAQIARDLRTLLPEHPQIKAQRAQLADIETQIRGAAERQARAVENEARAAAARVEALTASVEEQKVNAGRANADEVQLRALEREARGLRDQLEAYLVRQREAVAREAENAAPADARIISTAIVPTRPTFPKKLPIILIAGLCMFAVSSALVAAREILAARGPVRDPSLQLARGPMPLTPTEGEQATLGDASPVVAVVSTGSDPVAGATRGDSVAVVGESPEDVIGTSAGKTEAIENNSPEPDPGRALLSAIAAKIAESRVGGEALRLLLVSHDQHAVEVAVGLARGMSEDEQAILVSLSADPASSDNEQPAGITDLVAGRASFMEAIVRDPASRLHRIALGRGAAVDMIAAGDTFAQAMDALAATYDAVVIDAPFDLDEETTGMLAAASPSIILVCSGNEPDARIGANFLRYERLTGREPYVLMLGGGTPQREAA